MIEAVPLRDLLSFVVDNRGKTCPISSSGLPLIATNCVKNSTLYPVFEKVRFVDDDTYRNWFRAHPKPGDLIFVLKGSPGQVCITPDPVNFCIAQDMVALRPNPDLVYPPYLFAVLRSQDVQNEIANLHVGSLIPHFKKGDFDRLEIPLPPSDLQQVIGDFYLRVSEKIESNQRTCRTLEEMTRALYRSWFVNFDPVWTKLEGREPAHMDAATAALFPGSFDDDGLPVGWRTGQLSDIAINPRTGIKPEQIHSDTPYIGLEHMPRRSIALLDWGTAADVGSQKSGMSKGDFLFGKLRPYFHKVGISPVDGICSTDIIVVRPKSPEWAGLVLSTISSDDFVEHTNASSSGTRMPRTNWQDMGAYEITLPSSAIASAFESITKSWRDRIVAGVHEAKALATLRDTLLPRLMSGELRVGEAREMVEEVA